MAIVSTFDTLISYLTPLLFVHALHVVLLQLVADRHDPADGLLKVVLPLLGNFSSIAVVAQVGSFSNLLRRHDRS